jgi:hypothetical protein
VQITSQMPVKTRGEIFTKKRTIQEREEESTEPRYAGFLHAVFKTKPRDLFCTILGFRLWLYQSNQTLRVRVSSRRESQYSRYSPNQGTSNAYLTLESDIGICQESGNLPRIFSTCQVQCGNFCCEVEGKSNELVIDSSILPALLLR